jgi:hypothetical protein
VRIPFPERVPLNRAALFAAVLFAVQRLEHTAFYFSFGCAVFILIAVFAFNLAGGLTRISGAYVFFYSLLVVIVGICYKACLGEPGDSNLLDPRTDIEAYVGSIAAMLAAVIVSRRFSRKTGLLQNLLKDSRMYRAYVGCVAFGIAGSFIIALMGEGGAKLQSAFGQLNQLVPLGILIGVMYEIRRSGGTRSVSPSIVLAASYYFFAWGLLSFSKQGLLLPLLCWALPVCALRYRLTGVQVLACLLGVFLIFHYLFPYAQYGRSFREDNATYSRDVAIAMPLIEHPMDTRKKYEETTTEDPPGYYNTTQGFWDRLQMISVDDGLINATDQGKVFGLWPVKATFLNAIPHILWPDKPDLRFGNRYTHEFNPKMPEEDTTTGISYSATAEGYHWAKWVGILVVAPLLWFLLFIVYDKLLGDLRASPWGLLVIAQISHTAPEGMLSGVIYLVTFGVEIFVFCALFATYIAPLFAIAVLGPDRRQTAHLNPLRYMPIPAHPHKQPTGE